MRNWQDLHFSCGRQDATHVIQLSCRDYLNIAVLRKPTIVCSYRDSQHREALSFEGKRITLKTSRYKRRTDNVVLIVLVQSVQLLMSSKEPS